MNGTRTLVEMGEHYEKTVIEEKKSAFPNKDTFKAVTDKVPVEAKADKNAFVPKNSGPENADGFKKNIIDPKTSTNKKNFYEPKKYSQNYEKTEAETINNFMNKSIFDKLYEDVMSDQLEGDTQDAEALGLPSDDTGSEDTGEEVSFTLPREAAQKLHDALAAALGGEEEKADEESDLDVGDDEANEEKDKNEKEKASDEDAEENAEDEESEGVAKEATELKELPDSAGQSLQKKDNKVGDVTKSLVAHGAGDGKVTDKVGNDGEKGHALVGAGVKGGAPTSPKGKANVVVNAKTSKVGAYLAGLK